MAAEQAASWTGAGHVASSDVAPSDLAPSEEQRTRDEATVKRGFWSKLRRSAARLPFAEDALTAYYCAFDRNTPRQVQAALLAALAYFVVPLDVLPDVMPILGFTDDAAVLASALRMLAVHVRPEHRTAAHAALERELGR